MGELQGIQDTLIYALDLNQSSGIRIYTVSQAAPQAPQALENLNRCFAAQIM